MIPESLDTSKQFLAGFKKKPKIIMPSASGYTGVQGMDTPIEMGMQATGGGTTFNQGIKAPTPTIPTESGLYNTLAPIEKPLNIAQEQLKKGTEI